MDPSRANRRVDLERRVRAAEWPLPVLPVHVLLAHELEHAARKEAVAEGSYLREFLDNDLEASRAQVDADEALRLARLEQLTLATRYESAPALLRQSNRREYQRADDCAAHARGDTNLPTYDSARMQALRHIATTHGDPLKDAVYAQASSSSDVVDLYLVSEANCSHVIRINEMIGMLDVASEGTMRGTVFNLAWHDDMPSFVGGAGFDVDPPPAPVVEPKPKAEPEPIPAAVPLGVRERASTWASEGGRNPYRVRSDLQPVGSFAPLDEPTLSGNTRVLFLAQQGDTARRDWLRALWARYQAAEDGHRQAYGGPPFSVNWLVSNMTNTNQDQGLFDQMAYSARDTSLRWPSPYAPMVETNPRDFDFAAVYAQQPGTVPSTSDRVIESSWDPTIRYYPFTFYKRAAVAGSKAALYKYCYLMWRVIKGRPEEPDRDRRYVPVYPRVGPEPGPNQIDRRPIDGDAIKNEMDTIFRLCQGGLSYLDTHDADEQAFFQARGHLRRGMTPEQFDEVFFARGHAFELDFTYYQQDALYTAAIRPRRTHHGFFYRTATFARNAFHFAARGIDGDPVPSRRLNGVYAAMVAFGATLLKLAFVEGFRRITAFHLVAMTPDMSLPVTLLALYVNITAASFLLSAAPGLMYSMLRLVGLIVEPMQRQTVGPWAVARGTVSNSYAMLQVGSLIGTIFSRVTSAWPAYRLARHPDRTAGIVLEADANATTTGRMEIADWATMEALENATATRTAADLVVRDLQAMEVNPERTFERARAMALARERLFNLRLFNQSAARGRGGQPSSVRLAERQIQPVLSGLPLLLRVNDVVARGFSDVARAIEADPSLAADLWTGYDSALHYGFARENRIGTLAGAAYLIPLMGSTEFERVVNRNIETAIERGTSEQHEAIGWYSPRIGEILASGDNQDQQIVRIKQLLANERAIVSQGLQGSPRMWMPGFETWRETVAQIELFVRQVTRDHWIFGGESFRQLLREFSLMETGHGHNALFVRRARLERELGADLVRDVVDPALVTSTFWQRIFGPPPNAMLQTVDDCIFYDGWHPSNVEGNRTAMSYLRMPPEYNQTTTPPQHRLFCAMFVTAREDWNHLQRLILSEPADPRAQTLLQLWQQVEEGSSEALAPIETGVHPGSRRFEELFVYPTREDMAEAERIEQEELNTYVRRAVAAVRLRIDAARQEQEERIATRHDIAGAKYQLETFFTMGVGRITGLTSLRNIMMALPSFTPDLTDRERALMAKWKITDENLIRENRFVSLLTSGMNYMGGQGHAAWVSYQYWVAGFALPFLDVFNVWAMIGGWRSDWSAIAESLSSLIRDEDQRLYGSIILLDVGTGLLTDVLDIAGWSYWARHWHVTAAVATMPFLAALMAYLRSSNWQLTVFGTADDLLTMELRLGPLRNPRNIFRTPETLSTRRRLLESKQRWIIRTTWAWSMIRDIGYYLYHLPGMARTLITPVLSRLHNDVMQFFFYHGPTTLTAAAGEWFFSGWLRMALTAGGALQYVVQVLIDSVASPTLSWAWRVVKLALVAFFHQRIYALADRIDSMIERRVGGRPFTGQLRSFYFGTYPLNVGAAAFSAIQRFFDRGNAIVPFEQGRVVPTGESPELTPPPRVSDFLLRDQNGLLALVQRSEATRLAWIETDIPGQVWAANADAPLQLNHRAHDPSHTLGVLFTMGGSSRLPPVVPLDARHELANLVRHTTPPMVKVLDDDWRDSEDGDDLALSYNLADTSALVGDEWDMRMTMAPEQSGNTMLS